MTVNEDAATNLPSQSTRAQNTITNRSNLNLDWLDTVNAPEVVEKLMSSSLEQLKHILSGLSDSDKDVVYESTEYRMHL